MSLKSLVLASHNTGKLKEFEALLTPIHVTVTSAASLGLPEPEEAGNTFQENAEIKARAAATATGKPSLSDDSGLVIPALGGAPGIFSARWAGKDKDFTGAFARIQRELAALGKLENADAYFICVLCLALPGGPSHFFKGRVDGTLTFPPRGPQGFGYDPIFTPRGERRTFGEMPADEKHAMSHRARAFAQLVAFLKVQD